MHFLKSKRTRDLEQKSVFIVFWRKTLLGAPDVGSSQSSVAQSLSKCYFIYLYSSDIYAHVCKCNWSKNQ